MKRSFRFYAVTGTILLSGCAHTKPAIKSQSFASAYIPAAIQPPQTATVSSGVLIAPVSAESFTERVPDHAVTALQPPTSEVVSSPAVPPTITGEMVSFASQGMSTEVTANNDVQAQAMPINLPTALAMIGGQHPVVGFAQWRVREAYAQMDRAKVMWLPSIQSGWNYRRHNGIYQAVDGSIVDVNLNSLNYGLGAGAVAAGNQTRPGVVAQFHVADALFLPKAAEKNAWARGHAATAAFNQQLLAVAMAYMELLEAYQDAQIISESVARTNDLVSLTTNFAQVGEGLQSDVDRTQTELTLIKNRQLAASERQLVASTRLARAMSIPMTSQLSPQDSMVVPLELTPIVESDTALIPVGLATRPELKESQALVAAACEAYKREKYAPFVPSMLLGFSTNSFGGGLGSQPENFGGRYDADALMVWELRNLGLGENAARRERNSQVQQATFVKLRLMDQVAQEVAEAASQVAIRKQQVQVSQTAIAHARASYDRNRDRIREAKGLPIEALQAIQSLENAERAYLRAVVDYNRAQLQLQWALGWPVDAYTPTETVATSP